MSVPYPPPPPPPPSSQAKARPRAVTQKVMLLLLISVIIIVVAALEFAFLAPPWSYLTGAVTLILGVLVLIDAFGLFMGQPWALKFSGWSKSAWAQTADVREYFGLPKTYTAYPTYSPTGAPPSPPCPTCGQPLRYVEQYKKWYCDREQKYM